MFWSPPISIMISGFVHGLNAAGVAGERALIAGRPGRNAEFSNSPARIVITSRRRAFYELKAQAAQQVLAVSTEDVYESA
jgi:hypothetical protein